MRVDELIREMSIEGPLAASPEVRGVTHDSRRVRAGDLFVALRGERFDGRDFAAEAVARGAVAVLGSGPAPEGLEGLWLATEDPRAALGPLSARLYGHPDRELLTVGVTGTNGKSTVVELVAAMLDAAGRPAGVLGTLGYRFGDLAIEGRQTTPEASDLFSTLRRMRDAGAEAVAMEVSSHALALHRVDGASFDLAVFTNLSRDHFDFHRDFEDYFAAKRSLFGRLKPGGRAVVNLDDRYGARLAGEVERPLTFGDGGEVRILESELDAAGMRGTIATPRGELRFGSQLLGAFNVSNVVAAVAAAEALSLPRTAIREALAGVAPLPGRMQPVDRGQPFPVVVDYAHTEAALAAAIRSLGELAAARVIVVFGCGGDRDPGKRAPMGRVAGELAERPILTTDNPRHEDPGRILAAVEEGLRESGNDRYEVIADRRSAIRRAVELAGPGWAVLVAGKGHEPMQIVGDKELPFSDREEVERALEERFGAGKAG